MTIKWWALTDPQGRIIGSTIAPTKDECWVHGYWAVAHERGEEWQNRFWKRWGDSIRSASRLGYKFIRVNIVPTENRSQREEK